MRPRPYWWLTGMPAAVTLLALLVVGCAPTVVAGPEVSNLELRSVPTPRPAPPSEPAMSCSSLASLHPSDQWPVQRTYPLRGDPAFRPDRLDPAVRHWYDRLWDVIRDPDWAAYATSLAQRDDLYTYGRTLHMHVQSLLLAFRVTGDLALLDEVDRLAEHMRSRLRDGWRGTLDGSDGTRDGYLNWVYRREGARQHQGKDLYAFNEMRTHGLVAEIAWAFHHNRDLSSPNGVDYEHRARVWTSYLVGHFEEKWRVRSEATGMAFPFLHHDSLHGTVAFIKYHHYLAKTLDEPRYANEAERLSSLVLETFVEVPVGQDVAAVWPGRLSAAYDDGDRDALLLRTTYARYVIMDAIDLHLDGAALWRDPSVPASLATTLRAFVFDVDGDDIVLASDIGGGRSRGGIAAHDPDDAGEFSTAQFAVSGLAFAAAWDPSGDVSQWSCELFVRHAPGGAGVHLPAALMLVYGVDRSPPAGP